MNAREPEHKCSKGIVDPGAGMAAAALQVAMIMTRAEKSDSKNALLGWAFDAVVKILLGIQAHIP